MNMGISNSIKLINDVDILNIPINENNEPMIDLKKEKVIAYGGSPEIPNNTCYTLLRKTVYEKLKVANKLCPKGYSLCLYEAYRSLELQKMLFDLHFNDNQKLFPNASRAEIFERTVRLISPVTNLDGSKNIPPHNTGAAIDVYLVDAERNYIDMGIHPEDWMTDSNAVLSKTHSLEISETAKRNREIMSDVLTAVGFVNYPHEYWHWSYGDRYWAYQTKHDVAIYGPFEL